MIKRLFRIIFVALILTMLLGGIVYAVTWEYKYPVYITDTSATDRTYVPMNLGFGGDSLIAAGKMGSDGLDTNLQVGTSDVKYMLVSNKCMAVLPNLPNSTTVTADFYTGYSPEQSGFPVIVGNNGYVTVADNANLEWGATGKITFTDTYLNTTAGANKDLFYHYDTTNGGIICHVSPTVSENVTLDIYQTSQTASATPNSAYNEVLTDFPAAGFNYEKVDDPIGTPDDSTTYVQDVDYDTSYEIDTYHLTTPSIPSNARDITATITFRAVGVGGATCKAKVAFRWGASYIYSSEQTLVDGVWTTHTLPVSRPTGGSWVASDDYTGLMIMLALQDDGSHAARCTQIYATFTYQAPDTSISVVGIPSGEKADITISISGGNLALNIDGTTNSTAYAAIPNSTASWLLVKNNVMPYTESVSLNVSGVQQLYYAPNQMISGTTLPDRASDGTNNAGTITFGANSDLTISYGAMVDYLMGEEYVPEEGLSFTMPESDMPSTWYEPSSDSDLSGLPFYENIVEVAASTGQSIKTLYFIGILSFAFGVFMLLSIFTKSVLLAVMGLNITLFIGSSMLIVPMWLPFSVIVVQLGIMYLYRQVNY